MRRHHLSHCKKLLRDKFSAEEAARVTFAPTPVVEDVAHLLFNKNRADAEDVMAAPSTEGWPRSWPTAPTKRWWPT